MSTPTHPDWAALFEKHRDAMYRVAASVLRGRGLANLRFDAVQNAMESLIRSPPKEEPRSWEAYLVLAAKRRALDIIKSADVRHASDGALKVDKSAEADDFAEAEEAIDRQRRAVRFWSKLNLLDGWQRYVAEQYLTQRLSRQQVAEDLGVTPARISQIARQASEVLREAMEEGG